MTHMDTLMGGEETQGMKNDGAIATKGHQSDHSDGMSISQEGVFKTIKVYQNGNSSERIFPLPLEQVKKSQSWTEVLKMLHEAVKVPVQKVFTVQGKRVLSWTELGVLAEVVVVSGNEHFKMLPYGKESQEGGTPKSSEKKSNKALSKTKGRKSGANLAKSVIDESSCSSENENVMNHGKHLMKTLSEQDVSLGDSSNKVRYRQSSPKPRPVSAYNQQHGHNMSSSAERRALGLGGVSRIPKRIISPFTPTSNSISNSSPIVPPSHQIKPRRLEKTPPVAVVTEGLVSKRESARNEFIRPKLVTVIRHGMKPRKSIRFLLNKKTARSYDQVLNELTETIRPDWGAIRKIYTLTGNDVVSLEDFFGEEDIFLACPNDRLGTNDFDLDSEECKSIQPYVKASLTFKQSRFKGLEASRSPLHQRRPKSCSNSNSQNQTPPHPKYIPLAHFPAAILDKYYVGNIIGDGNFAVVRECTDRCTKERFALKVIDKAKCQGRDAPPVHEVKILGMVRHPNIIEMFEQYDFTTELYIVLELVEGGDLFDAIAAVTKFTEKDSKSMTRDIASALAFLHSISIVHRDIKPENLLVYTNRDGERRIKLGDFGLAKIADGPLFTVCGTPTYVAPEILSESGYGLKVDVWALGVIIYVLLCGFPPFISPTGEQETLFELILSAEYDFPVDDWENISEDAKSIISKMLEPDTDIRLSAEEVLDHPWLCVNAEEAEARRRRQQRDFTQRVFEAMGLTSPLSLSQY